MEIFENAYINSLAWPPCTLVAASMVLLHDNKEAANALPFLTLLQTMSKRASVDELTNEYDTGNNVTLFYASPSSQLPYNLFCFRHELSRDCELPILTADFYLVNPL